MSKLTVKIGRVVVHGGGSFSAGSFTQHLRDEIASRIESGAATGELAARIPGDSGVRQVGTPTMSSGKSRARDGVERVAASAVATRVLN